MKPILGFIALVGIIFVGLTPIFTPSFAALDPSKPSNAQPTVIANKVTIYPGAHVTLRNVDVSKLPPIVIQSGSTVVIGRE